MTRTATRVSTVFALLACVAVLAAATDEPESTPTPTPAAKADNELSSVAGEIKLNKEATGSGGPIVITNENLPALADQGRVTEVTKPGGGKGSRSLSDAQGPGAGIEGKAPGYAETAEKKQYWQSAYTRQLDLIKEIYVQIEALDREIPGLWRDFYAWDDPAYRDGVIKPRLDEALARRQRLEVDLQDSKTKLEEIKSDARKDGAEPGWFRGLGSVPTPKPTVGIMPP